jgi:hypothetical protein
MLAGNSCAANQEQHRSCMGTVKKGQKEPSRNGRLSAIHYYTRPGIICILYATHIW